MPSWTERLKEQARDRLNRLQDRIVDFERDGGVQRVVERVADRIRNEEERIASGRHPLNPDYQLQVRQWYARLEIPPGSNADAVRTAYRDLMRRYHPDRNSQTPEIEALATRISQDLTEAVEGLLEHLGAS